MMSFTFSDGFLDWLIFAYDICLCFAEHAVMAGFSASVLAIVVLAINLVARRWLSASQMGVLWALVLLRMVMPIAPSSEASVHNLLIYLMSEPSSANRIKRPVDDLTPHQKPLVLAVEALSTQRPAAADAVEARPRPPVSDFRYSLPIILAAPFLFVLASNLYTHWRFSRRVKRSPACDDDRVLALWQRCRDELGMRRQIPVIACDDVSQPAIMGVIRPKLLLPSHCSDLTDEQLRLVMLHELMHVRRFDVAVNWLLVFVRAVQWWNPIYWLANSRFVGLREQARDAMVLRHVQGDETSSRRYSELLLTLAERGSPQRWRVMIPASLLGFISGWFRKRGIANRLRALRSAVPAQRRWHRFGVVGLLLAIACAGLTNAAGPKKPPVDLPRVREWRHITDRAVTQNDNGVYVGVADEEFSGLWTGEDYNMTAGVEIISKQRRCKPEDVSQFLKFDLMPHMNLTRVTTATDSNGVVTAETQQRPYASLRRKGQEWVVHVYGPPAVHQRMQRFIHAYNRSGMGLVAIEAWIATTPHDAMKRLDLTWDRMVTTPIREEYVNKHPPIERIEVPSTFNPSATGVASIQEQVPLMVKVLSPAEAKRFVDHCQDDERSDIRSAPQMKVFNGQTVQIGSVVQRPFVTGFAQDDAGATTPQIEVIEDGTKLALAVEIAETHDATDIGANLAFSEVQDVRVISATLHGKDVKFQAPRVSRLRVSTSKRLQNDQTLLICIPPLHDRKEYTWVLLSPRIVEEE